MEVIIIHDEMEHVSAAFEPNCEALTSFKHIQRDVDI